MFDDGFLCKGCMELRNNLKGDLFCKKHKDNFAAKLFIPLKDVIEKYKLKLDKIIEEKNYNIKKEEIEHDINTGSN